MKQRGALIVLALAGLLLCTAIANHMYIHDLAIDWRATYRPTAWSMAGQNPYELYNFYNPPWTVAILGPFVLLPPPWDHAVWMFVGAIAFAYIAKQLKASPWALLLIFLSPPVLDSLICGQLEWVVLIGMWIPMWAGLPLMMIKPQVSFVFVAWKTWFIIRHRHGWAGLWHFVPFLALLGVSLWCFPGKPWPLYMLDAAKQTFAWPYLIPVGLALVYKCWNVYGLQKAMMASPFLSPHAWPYSFAGAVLALAEDTKLLAIVVAGMWAVKLLC